MSNNEKFESEILSYFQRHPAAADTVEGVLEWWLMRQRLETAIEDVQSSLDELVKDGLVSQFPGPDGRFVYRLERKPSTSDSPVAGSSRR